MHVVAIFELATSIEAEAAALAADLGTTAYEERLKLAAGLPAIVLTSADPERARVLLDRIRARRHGALAVDGAEVVPSSAMVTVRRFAFETDALVLQDAAGSRLPYEDLFALVRAVHRTRVEARTPVQTTSFSMVRALASNGVLMTKTTRREERSIVHDRDPVLYLFRASGQTPWLVRERSVDYSALGPALQPVSAQNFLHLIERLRGAALHAVYDDRLVSAGSASMRPLHASAHDTATSSANSVDLLAYLLSRWAGRRSNRGPFR